MNEREQLEQAILALETQRATLGDAVVDAAISSMREKLAALNEQAAPARSMQQRKHVTVLFADVAGFTSIAESLDAENLSEIMNALWGHLDSIITNHDGQIDKHIGDAVMALWGAEAAREDDPEQAIRAGLAMQVQVADFGVQLANIVTSLKIQNPLPRIEMRVGINTGPVLLGSVGTTGELSVIGGTVNLASRLERAAPIGGVLISHNTYRQVRGVFDVLPQEPMLIKGRLESVQTFVVQRAKARAWRLRTRGIEGIETHMVGRDAELLALKNAFKHTMKHVQTRQVTIVGEAGLGKSRLLYEFDNWVELLPEQIYYFKGRALPAMQTVPFGIIRDMFAYRFNILETDNASVAMEKFRVGTQGILDADRADLVGHLIGFDFSGSQRVQNLLGSPSFSRLATVYLNTYIQNIATEPTLILLEDIHWADNRSLDLINQLTAQMKNSRLFIVCLTRPLLFERRPDLCADTRPLSADKSFDNTPHSLLKLEPLSPDDSQALVSELLQKVEAVPQTLRDLIVQAAEGNPYYVEELVKMLIEDGVIVRGDERWHVQSERLTAIRVPSTLTGVLQARLDGLPFQEREVLQRAAVVGRLFWEAAVSALFQESDNGAEQKQISALLDALCERELIFMHRRSAFEGTTEYIFQHALLHNVVYETVLLKLRRIYHLKIARWLENNAKERIAEFLTPIARHYELAGESVKAAGYLRQSGEETFRVSSFYDAIDAFERALTLLTQATASKTQNVYVDERATLLVRLGYTWRQISDYSRADECFQSVFTLLDGHNLKNPQTEVAVLNGMGWNLMGSALYEQALPYLEQALTLAHEINDQAGIVTALHNLGEVAYRQGDADLAAKYAGENLALCWQLGDRQEIAGALRVLGFVAFMRGDYAESAHYHAESQMIYKDIGDRRGVAACFINVGESLRGQRDYQGAIQNYKAALPIHREIGNRLGIAIVFLNLGAVYIKLDEDEQAWSYLAQALQQATDIGTFGVLLESLVSVAMLQTKVGRYQEAAKLLGLVRKHQAYNAEIEHYANLVLEALRQALSPERFAAALARGALLDLDTVVTQLLSEGVAH